MAIRITARPVRGIRRVGIFHPPEPAVFPDEYFSEQEIETLRNDKDLIVERLDDEFVTPGEKRHLELLTGTADGAAADDVQDSGQAGGEGNPPPGADPELPPVAKLAEFIADLGLEEIGAMQQRDDRKSAQPIYEARAAQLRNPNSDPHVAAGR